MESDLTPLGGAVNDQQDIANLGGFEYCACDPGLLYESCDIEQAGKIKVTTGAAKFSNLRGQLLLLGDPGGIGGRNKG
jgi:hypothetical protein